MADHRNDMELDQGKRPVFELRIPADMVFVFGVDEVYPYGDSTILAGEIFRGEIAPGAVVSYGEIGVGNIPAPNEEKKTMEPVQRASKEGAMGGRYALVVTGRESKHFKPGGIVFARKMN